MSVHQNARDTFRRDTAAILAQWRMRRRHVPLTEVEAEQLVPLWEPFIGTIVKTRLGMEEAQADGDSVQRHRHEALQLLHTYEPEAIEPRDERNAILLEWIEVNRRMELGVDPETGD